MSLPVTAKTNKKGHLEIGGCDLVELAREFGTPLYVLDEKTLRDRCRDYGDSFKQAYPNSEIAFASKALCTIGVSKLIASEGLGFDVSSGGELYTVLKAGADPKKIYFHGNNKPPREIDEALAAGIGRFMVDNEQELGQIERAAEKMGVRANIMVRVNPGIEAHTHEFVQTGRIDSKFGVPLDQLDSFLAAVKKCKMVHLTGFHAHIGSQILDVKPFVEETRLLLDLTLKYGTAEIGLGGGIGISYLPEQKPPTIREFAAAIAGVLRGKTEAKLILEPGRSIVGQAGVTLYTAGVVKEIPGVRKYVITDGGMADNPRPILYDAVYEAVLANKAKAEAEEKYRVVGRFCESGDILIKEASLPRVTPGDILVTTCTGAYNYSMASNYNRVPRPALVMVHNGRAAVVVRRESYADLVKNDAD
ncbi:MAG: diaminopimelate decarboxylase [Candidatus Margulisbacteria bacterium]|jgi:diaminopimelate decarboxylase|nr:diaminopimelate decarboxylase [Candidatus Margulisiibacteriota bacterium]